MRGSIVALMLFVGACAEGDPLQAPNKVGSHRTQNEDAAPVRFLTGSIEAQLPHASALLGRRALFVLTAENCFTCEDLGRQLREVLRSPSVRRLPLSIVVVGNDMERVRGWLRRERIRPENTIEIALGLRLNDGTLVPTPAVILIDASGRIERGVAHLTKVNNSRPRSFASELGLLAP